MNDGLTIDKYGNKYWYLNGERHRTDGPATEYPTGEKRWFINGNELSEEEYLRTTRNKKLEILGL